MNIEISTQHYALLAGLGDDQGCTTAVALGRLLDEYFAASRSSVPGPEMELSTHVQVIESVDVKQMIRDCIRADREKEERKGPERIRQAQAAEEERKRVQAETAARLKPSPEALEAMRRMG